MSIHLQPAVGLTKVTDFCPLDHKGELPRGWNWVDVVKVQLTYFQVFKVVTVIAIK